MPPQETKSMRALARAIGVSLATVSDSLRGNLRVSVKTRERVREAAKKLGYVYNPLAGSVMSEIRRSSVASFLGVVAVVDLERPRDRVRGAIAYHQLVRDGAEEAARRMGYKVDFFNAPESDLSIKRLGDILESRGISAVLFLPMFGKPNISALNWERLTGIYTDYLIDDPPINRIAPDHFKSMIVALRKLTELGYKRPGLVLQRRQAERLMFRWEAAFDAFWSHHADGAITKHLIFDELNRESFVDWFRATKPDVVMCHQPETLDWMRQLGCRVPETHGFCCLNVTTAGVKTAGLDLLPRLVGERGMEALVAQLQHNKMGVPEVPLVATFEAAWRDGPTLRNRAESPKPQRVSARNIRRQTRKK